MARCMGDMFQKGYGQAMKNNANTQYQAFGRNRSRCGSLEQLQVRKALASRLDDKAAGYERAAARLELRGDEDAAKVLFKAADQLRGLINNAAKKQLTG